MQFGLQPPAYYGVPGETFTDLGYFVAEDPRRGEQTLVDLFHVCAADSAHVDPNHHFTLARFRSLQVFEIESARPAIDGGTHQCHRSMAP